MNKILLILAVCVSLTGCNQDTPRYPTKAASAKVDGLETRIGCIDGVEYIITVYRDGYRQSATMAPHINKDTLKPTRCYEHIRTRQ